MIEYDDEACIRALNRLYCYLRHAGIEPRMACETLEAQMRLILDREGGINPARLTREGGPRDRLQLPRPAPAPAPVRGHLGYSPTTD